MIASLTCDGAAAIASKGAKGLTQRIDSRSLTETDEEAIIVFHREAHAAVGTSECSEIGDYPVSPQGRVLDSVARQVRISGDPTYVVDAMSAASENAAQRSEVPDGVMDLLLLSSNRDCRRSDECDYCHDVP